MPGVDMASGATAFSVSPMGLPNKPTIVGSADNAASNSQISAWNGGLIVKCSGCHCMNPAVYGTNRGREVELKLSKRVTEGDRG